MQLDPLWKYLVIAVGSYLLGCISTGLLISKNSGHNSRREGSRNIGATNVLRTVGTAEGLLPFLGDFAKAAAAVLLSKAWMGLNGAMVAGLMVVIGHNWPVTGGFQGGKGISCTAGAAVCTFFWQGAASCGFFLVVVFLTRYVSLSSLAMCAMFALLVSLSEGFWPYGVWAIVLALLAAWRHKANIQRLLSGTEHKFTLKKKK